MTNIFVVRLYTSSGVGGTAVFSTLESAKQLVARLNEHKKFIDNHRHILRPHEFEHIDRETGEMFLFSDLSDWISVDVEKTTLHQ
jgi:hypothetical protein